MEKAFEQFLENIRLTETQEEDAKTKYNSVCKKLHNEYYSDEYDGSTKFLFGSYKTKTNIRPITEKQDVDVMFIMPESEFEKYNDYETNGQSALLQKIRELLKDKFTTTEEIRSWGKVVLIKFADGTHNIELLPAWTKGDIFIIPNTENGGHWEEFNPKIELKRFTDSNKRSNGLTRNLCKMVKKWRNNTSSLVMTSYEVFNNTLDFIDIYDIKNKTYPEILLNMLNFLQQKNIPDQKSHIETALNRIKKAIEFYKKGDLKSASLEYKKIFGEEFPLIPDSTSKDNFESILITPQKIIEHPKQWAQ